MAPPLRYVFTRIALFFCVLNLVHAQDWQSSVTTSPPGSFPQIRPLHASYRFGWSGLTAAHAEVRLNHSNGRSVLRGSVQTTDAARALWPFDADYSAIADSATLRPVEVKQSETTRAKKVTTELTFDARGVISTRSEVKHDKGKPGGAKRFDFANLYDLQTSLLYLRSQPLANGSSYRLVVFPGKDPYLATVKVERRERISVAAGSFNAIRMNLQLSKIDKEMQLKPHKKFHNATVWISDDSDRILLRAEADVFIGTVFAELQSVDYQGQLRKD